MTAPPVRVGSGRLISWRVLQPPETCRPARHLTLTPFFLVSGIFWKEKDLPPPARHVSVGLSRLCTFLLTYEMFFF